MLNLALPLIGIVAEALRSRQKDIATQTGLPEDMVGKVGAAVSDFLTRDERARAAIAAELAAGLEQARAHDIATHAKEPPLVNLMRGLVRPVITLTAFVWYVGARASGIELGAEDYAIIGGIVAFWFGFRPFEKPHNGLPNLPR